MVKCPKCGSDKGWYTTFVAKQYYTANGEPDGYEIDDAIETKYAKCQACDKRILLVQIIKEANKE